MNKIVLGLIGLYYMFNLHPQQITGLTLLNALTNSDIKALEQDDTIYPDLTGSNLNIRADVSGTVGSVQFGYNGISDYTTENVAPYTFAGDTSGDYNSRTHAEGKHTITATAYSDVSAKGTSSESFTINFSVNDSSNNGGGLETDCHIAPFKELNNIVVVEVESVPPGSGWTKEYSADGFTGDAYYRWTGGNLFNSPGNGLTEYKIYIAHPGTYHFRWHSKIMHGSDPTESNDSWLRIPDAYDFFAKKGSSVKYPRGGKFIQSNTIVNGSSSNGWMKVYSSGTTNWTWSCRTSDHDPHEIYATFQEAGVYTVQISGRSNNHAIDRFVLFKDSEYTVSEATSKDLAETRCGPIDEWPEYTVKFQVTDGANPIEGATVSFYGMDVQTDSLGEAIFYEILTSENRSFSVSAECYVTESGSIDISSDMEHLVELTLLDEPPCNGEPVLYSVVFNVSSGYKPLIGAEVIFNDSIKTTGTDGTIKFDSIEAKNIIVYIISFPGFAIHTDSMDLTGNTRINITLESNTSSESLSEPAIRIYPNPVPELLYIEGLKGNNYIYLHSIDGKILRHLYSPDEKINITFTGLSSGIYILRVIKENGIILYRGLIEKQ
ncbi:MAG: T9SS type A sorting domain-containing protein [bacterium]